MENTPLFNDLVRDLCDLLDLIELEGDASLAAGRFDIFHNHGIDVVFTGEPGSGSKN